MATLEEFYTRGCKDAADDDYDPPHSDLFSYVSYSDSDQEETRAYNKGYWHTKGQIDAGNENYDPPRLEDHKEYYDRGYEGV